MLQGRTGLWWWVCWLVTGFAWAGGGSNLGGQAVHYSPPEVVGTVHFGAVPSGDALIQTVAGQRVTTDAAGAYQLTLNAPGLYRIAVGSLLNLHVVIVEVFAGQTLSLNVDLGTPCPIETWPATESVTRMIACINGNLPSP